MGAFEAKAKSLLMLGERREPDALGYKWFKSAGLSLRSNEHTLPILCSFCARSRLIDTSGVLLKITLACPRRSARTGSSCCCTTGCGMCDAATSKKEAMGCFLRVRFEKAGQYAGDLCRESECAMSDNNIDAEKHNRFPAQNGCFDNLASFDAHRRRLA